MSSTPSTTYEATDVCKCTCEMELDITMSMATMEGDAPLSMERTHVRVMILIGGNTLIPFYKTYFTNRKTLKKRFEKLKYLSGRKLMNISGYEHVIW